MENESHNKNVLKSYNMMLYFAGSMIMFEPSEECIADFWRNGIVNRLPVTSSNPNFLKAASQLRESITDSTTTGRMMKDDYIRLFSSREMPLAPAYESLYAKKANKYTERYSDNVTDFYNSYGWVSKFRGKIEDDHLGVEILFLTRLIDKYLLLDDEACRVELRLEIARFVENHILSWIGEWNNLVQNHSRTISFKAVGTLLLACTEDIFSILTMKKSVTVESRSSRN